jgi:hypothetical protein
MAYHTWLIGGLTPSWVEPVFKDDRPNNTLTLKCAAIAEELDADPITEIEAFDALTSQYINNTPLLNGGTKLQVGNGEIITVTASNAAATSTKTWTNCAIQRVIVDLDNFYDEDNDGSIIEYELVIQYEAESPNTVKVYTPPFTNPLYTNMEYYYLYDPGPPEVKTEDTSALNGTELGWMQITETSNVKRVEVYGCGCDVPGSKIYVNDVEQIWHYGEDPSNPVGLSTGTEKFTWDLDTPTNVITIKTTIHTLEAGENYGAWLQWIKLIFD